MVVAGGYGRDEDAVFGASSAVRRHSRCFARPSCVLTSSPERNHASRTAPGSCTLSAHGDGNRDDFPGRRATSQPRALLARVQRPGAGAGRRGLRAAAGAGEVLLDLLLEPGRVLHGPRRRAHGPGGGRRPRSFRRRADAVGDAGGYPGAHARSHSAPVAALEPRARAGAQEGRNRHCAGRRVLREGAGRARAPLRAGDLSRSDAARRGARAAVPVHLRPLEQPRHPRARPRERGGALCAREGARGSPSLPRSGQAGRVRPARGGDRALPRLALPADGDRRARRLPRHQGRRLRGLGRGRRPARSGRARAQAPPLRRRRPPRGLRLGVEPAPRPPDRGPGRERGPGLPDSGPARPRRPFAARGPRPARPQGRAVVPEHAGAARRGARRRRVLRRDPARATSSSITRTTPS